MFAADDAVEIVSKSLAGRRPVDEKTYASLAILTARLESLRSKGGVFRNIEFSEDMTKLKAGNSFPPKAGLHNQTGALATG
jgi:hypothetical protein